MVSVVPRLDEENPINNSNLLDIGGATKAGAPAWRQIADLRL